MMFHVEHHIADWFSGKNIDPGADRIAKLARYAALVHAAGMNFNLTGFKSLREITDHLVLSSLEPLLRINVPRGTRIADIGSGAGVPGIPLSIVHPSGEFHLLESNEKKASFIKEAVSEIGIGNVEAVNARAEDIGHDPQFRESFDFAIARAFAGVFVTIELAIPLLRTGGILYIYANDSFPESSPSGGLMDHIRELGAVVIDDAHRERNHLPGTGYPFQKISSTPERYPRRYAVIKRESARLAR